MAETNGPEVETGVEGSVTPPAATSNARGPLPLPSGKVAAVVRKPIGRDLIRAHTIVGAEDAENGPAVSMAIVAQIVTVGGERVTYEDLQEMDLGDVSALLAAALGNVPVPGLGTSSA
jgi:hypothetical protein